MLDVNYAVGGVTVGSVSDNIQLGKEQSFWKCSFHTFVPD